MPIPSRLIIITITLTNIARRRFQRVSLTRQLSKDVIELLLRYGSNIDAQKDNSGTALYAAANSNSKDNVELLLQYGADVIAHGGEYGNALQAAVCGSSIEVVELLLEHGADVNAQGGEFGNALQAAVYERWIEVVELLLKREADVNAQGGRYGNALQAAVFKSSKQVAELLLQRGVDVNAQGGLYGSALQAAVEVAPMEMAGLLFQSGADVMLFPIGSQSPLQYAAAENFPALVQVLLDMEPKFTCLEEWTTIFSNTREMVISDQTRCSNQAVEGSGTRKASKAEAILEMLEVYVRKHGFDPDQWQYQIA
ncbi:hypothetical protein VTL71DRAFT_1307 [Oculimacula yallundae]|uniref:Ankyrin n=1 Tax=Oculimacula yallundae TaxID=86028 RepID=A0ABR4CAB3_9HELO